MSHRNKSRLVPCCSLLLAAALLAGSLALAWRAPHALAQQSRFPPPARGEAYPLPPELQGVDLLRQTDAEASAKSAGCVTCHDGAHDPHYKQTVRLGCTDCHGGDAHASTKEQAHVHPHFPDAWRTSANPVRSYTLLNHETPDFVRFVNPGDLRIAHISCGTANCHPNEVLQNRKSMMAHGAMLWSAALYNNGSVPNKWARFGEAYSMHGVPVRL